MGDISKDILLLLTQLLPGFLTAWVVYGLTTHPKPTQFERVIQALIYSYVVSALVAAVELICLSVGKYFQFGLWTHSVELVMSGCLAISLGLVLSYFLRNDVFFRLARQLKITSRTPYPSEWYGAFASGPRFIVLHLANGRRISGYPAEWPTEATVGHFRLMYPAWINDDNSETALTADDSILIEAKMVEMVEFLKDLKEIAHATKVA